MLKAHRIAAGVATALLTVALSACSSGSSSAVVTVNGQAIPKSTLDSKLEASPAARQTLQQIVQQTLIDQYAKDNKVTVTDDEVNKRVNQLEAQYPNGQFDQLLKARGLSLDDVKSALREQIVLDKAVGANITITDAQIKAYFDKNHAQFDTPDQARARHILVPDLKMAQLVESDLKAGKDFAAEAKAHSVDPGSRDKGGELGFFRRGSMVPAFEKYAFTAPIGKISAPVKSPFGYHVIQVEERKQGQKATVASVHDQIAQLLRQRQESPLIGPFLQNLQAKANIKINDPRFDGLFPSPPPTAPAAAAAPSAPAPAATKK